MPVLGGLFNRPCVYSVHCFQRRFLFGIFLNEAGKQGLCVRVRCGIFVKCEAEGDRCNGQIETSLFQSSGKSAGSVKTYGIDDKDAIGEDSIEKGDSYSCHPPLFATSKKIDGATYTKRLVRWFGVMLLAMCKSARLPLNERTPCRANRSPG